MASSSTTDMKRKSFWANLREFPPVLDGRINIVTFLEASSDLIKIVDSIGKTFAPVKYDMQGNIDKIEKFYEYDDNSCLLELMLKEETKDKPGVQSVLWLNRALLFFEISFNEIIATLQSNKYDTSMKKIFTVAYEGSIKKYHNWVTQQLFAFICKMSPSLLQIMKSLEIDDVKIFESFLINFNTKMHLVRSEIDNFILEKNLIDDIF